MTHGIPEICIGRYSLANRPTDISFPASNESVERGMMSMSLRGQLIGYLTWFNDELEISVWQTVLRISRRAELAQSTLFRLSYVPTDRYVNEGMVLLAVQ